VEITRINIQRIESSLALIESRIEAMIVCYRNIYNIIPHQISVNTQNVASFLW